MHFHVHMTVNSPRGETDYNTECHPGWTIDQAIANAIKMHPSATSFNIAIVPWDINATTFVDPTSSA